MRILVYIIAASIWNPASGPSMDRSGEFASYQECVAGAKDFFYAKIPDVAFPPQGETELAGRLNFYWFCEGMVK